MAPRNNPYLAQHRRLFALVLLSLVLAEGVVLLLIHVLHPASGYTAGLAHVLLDIGVMAAICAPILWWFIVGPLHRAATGEKARLESARDRAETALRDSEKMLREITSVLGEAVYVLDREGRLTFMNPAAETLIGWREDELLGKNAHAAFHYRRPDGTPYPAAECPMFKTLQTGRSFRSPEDYVIHRNSQVIPVTIHSTPLFRKGEIDGAVAALHDITDEKKAQEEILRLAHYDSLTALPNRSLLADRLNQTLLQAERHRKLAAVLFLDLDRFKEINDTLGHDMGDELLKVVGQRLVSCVRKMDTVSRLGGDEFVIVLDEIAGAEDAEQVARKIIESVSRPILIGPTELHITTSIGISLYPTDGTDVSALLKHADSAMYQAKEHGRNSYCLYRAGQVFCPPV